MTHERPITFECGGDTLIGILHSPASLARDVGVLVVAGGPQYRVGSHRQFVLMARMLATSGYPVFRFDYRGVGDSDGGTRSFEEVSVDIRAAVDAFMAAEARLAGVVIWALCDGASAALMYCASDHRLRGLVVVNPWVRTGAGEARAYLRHYYTRRLLQPSFWRSALGGGVNPLRSAWDFVTALRVARGTGARRPTAPSVGFIDRMLTGLIDFRRPVLALISDRDLTAQEFMDLLTTEPNWRVTLSSPNLTITRLPDSDHTFSTRASLDRATEICIAWLGGLACTMP